jgi:hypothetical protein
MTNRVVFQKKLCHKTKLDPWEGEGLPNPTESIMGGVVSPYGTWCVVVVVSGGWWWVAVHGRSGGGW